MAKSRLANQSRLHLLSMETTIQTGALFDLDGVLIDSETLYTQFWDNIGTRFNLPSPTFAHDIKGCTLTDILNRYFPDQAQQVELTHLIHEFEDQIQYPIFPGAASYVESLRQRGVKVALVTSSDATKMSYLFAQHPEMEHWFDAIVNGSMVSRSKPDPEGYLLAAELIGCNIGQCIVYEDSFQGIEAGHRSGAKVIALATTNSRESLQGKADWIVDTISDLL